MKNILSLLLLATMVILPSNGAFAVNKIQQQGIKTAADCTGAGATLANCLPLDAQIYDSTNAQQLSVSIANGQLGGSGGSAGGIELLKNPGFESGVITNGWSSSGGTATLITSGSHLMFGNATASWVATASAQTFSSLAMAVNGLSSTNCSAYIYYNYAGTSGDYSIRVINQSSAILASATLSQTANSTQSQVLTWVCSSTTTDTVKLQVVSNVSSPGTIYFDNTHLGSFTSLYQVTDTPWASCGNVSLSSTGTSPTKGTATIDVDECWYKRQGDSARIRLAYSHSSPGTATTGTGDYLFWGSNLPLTIDTTKLTPYTTAPLGAAVQIRAYNQVGSGLASANGNTQISGGVWVYDSNHVRIGGVGTQIAGNNSAAETTSASNIPWASGFVGVSMEFTVPVTQYANSSIAVAMSQTDFGWIDGGPTVITATTTSPTKPSGIVTDHIWYRRVGQNLEVRQEYKQSNTTGAVNGSGDYLLQAIPSSLGLVIDTTLLTPYSTVQGNTIGTLTGVVGSGNWGNQAGSGTAYTGVVQVYDSNHIRVCGVFGSGTGYNNSSCANSSASPFTASTSVGFSITYSVPIATWTVNQNAPLIVGGVTSSSTNATEILNRAHVTNNGTTCVIDSQSGSWLSAAFSAQGTCNLTFTSGIWSVAPACNCTPDTGASAAVCDFGGLITTTSATTITFNSTNGGGVNVHYNIMCMGQH